MYLTIVIMAIVFAVVLGLSAVLFSQITVIRGIGDSVVALYIADAGVEQALFNIRKQDNLGNFSGDIGTGYEYSVEIDTDPITCPVGTCIKSLGTFKDTKRAIEASF